MSLVLAKRIMGLKCIASEEVQKHSEPFVLSFISSNYQNLKEGFLALMCITMNYIVYSCFISFVLISCFSCSFEFSLLKHLRPLFGTVTGT